MSVETQQQQPLSRGEAFACGDNDKSSPLNLAQIQRKNGRKTSTPQKSVTPEANGDDESGSEDAFPGDSRPEDDEILSGITEETKQKAKSILEHYRSFMQRNSHDGSSDLLQFGLRGAKLMKMSPTDGSSSADSWSAPIGNQNGDESMVFEATVSGPMNGPNGLIPERTMRQNNWAIKVWRDWALSRNRKPETKLERFPEAPVDIRVASVEVMSYWLPRFIKEVRRKDKKAYPPDTLMQIASGLQRYLRQVSCRSEINFFDKYSNTFADFRDALKTRSGELSLEAQASKSGKRMQVDNLSDDELWQSGYLDYSTAKGIFHVVFFYNCVEFEITSMEEHHELKVEQFHIGVDSNTNSEYIQFKRSDQRYYNMSTKLIMRRYSSPHDSRCLVKLYKAYLNLVPSTGPFYRRPLQTPENSSPRFSFNPVGINKLRETHKQLFSPDRPASLRQSGKTTTIRHVAQNGSSDKSISNSPSPGNSLPLTTTSQAVYDALTQRLKIGGHLRLPNDSAVDLSVKANDSAESDDEAAGSSEVESMMEQLRKNWQSMKQTSYHDNSKEDSEDDEVLTLKVPSSVKSVVIERDGKKQKFTLN